MSEENLSANMGVMRRNVRRWAMEYDLSVEENREAVRQWITVFNGLGDESFAKELEKYLNPKGSA